MFPGNVSGEKEVDFEFPVFTPHLLYMSLLHMYLRCTEYISCTIFFTLACQVFERVEMYTKNKAGPCISVILDCMNHSLVSAQRLLCWYFLVNISTNIWRGAFFRTQARPWVSSLFCRNKQKKIWPSTWNPASGFEGRVLKERLG